MKDNDQKKDNRLLVATYLTPEEKAWLKEEARNHSRSMAGQLRQMVVEQMQGQQANRYFS